MIDLHLHSFNSDGEFSPSELVKKAKQEEISVISLTDHDSTSGLDEAKSICDKLGICFIPGVELEAATDISRSKYIHILGYNFSNLQILNDYLTQLRQERIELINLYVEKFKNLGIYTSFEEIFCMTPGSHITPYNIPIFLYKKGYYNSFDSAKQAFIDPNGEYYIPRKSYEVDFIIDLIIKSDGIPVLAHPCRLPQKGEDLDLYVAELSQKGILGIETHYSTHTKEDTLFYKSLARKYNLLETAGSDYHSQYEQIKIGLSLLNEKQIVSNLLNYQKRD